MHHLPNLPPTPSRCRLRKPHHVHHSLMIGTSRPSANQAITRVESVAHPEILTGLATSLMLHEKRSSPGEIASTLMKPTVTGVSLGLNVDVAVTVPGALLTRVIKVPPRTHTPHPYPRTDSRMLDLRMLLSLALGNPLSHSHCPAKYHRTGTIPDLNQFRSACILLTTTAFPVWVKVYLPFRPTCQPMVIQHKCPCRVS